MSKGQRIGYIRVSGPDQNPDRQLEGIELDRKYIDYASGKTIQRKEFDLMMNFARDGDTILVHSADRIARNLMDLKKLVTNLNEKGISIEFKKENLYFSPGKEDIRSNLMLSILGAYAEFEHAIITERRREGMALARARGIVGGRKPVLTKEQMEEIRQAIANHERVQVLSEKYGVSRPTIYKCMKACKK